MYGSHEDSDVTQFLAQYKAFPLDIAVKMKQKLCANVPKGALNKFNVHTKNTLKWNDYNLQHNMKLTFTQKQIPYC